MADLGLDIIRLHSYILKTIDIMLKILIFKLQEFVVDYEIYVETIIKAYKFGQYIVIMM